MCFYGQVFFNFTYFLAVFSQFNSWFKFYHGFITVCYGLMLVFHVTGCIKTYILTLYREKTVKNSLGHKISANMSATLGVCLQLASSQVFIFSDFYLFSSHLLFSLFHIGNRWFQYLSVFHEWKRVFSVL